MSTSCPCALSSEQLDKTPRDAASPRPSIFHLAASEGCLVSSAPQWIRTTDLRLRRPALFAQICREKRDFEGPCPVRVQKPSRAGRIGLPKVHGLTASPVAAFLGEAIGRDEIEIMGAVKWCAYDCASCAGEHGLVDVKPGGFRGYDGAVADSHQHFG